MNCKIPFTKDILFEKKVSEITSISLEHEISTEDGMLKGNFIVSGDFKSHEVSVNKEAFSYMLPFEIELADDVDETTIEFMIDDFTYDIVDNSILRVNIDFNVVANKKEVMEEKTEEPLFRDASELFQDETLLEETKKPALEVPTEQVSEKEPESVVEQEEIEKKEAKEEVKEDRAPIGVQGSDMPEEPVGREKTSEDTIINSIKGANEDYTTYHIHMVNDGETVETICTMYNSNMNILSEYNELKDLTQGDKLIIPEKNE